MEQKNTKTIILSCAVIVLIACLCLGVIVISGIGISSIWPLFTSAQATLPPTSTATQVTREIEDEETPTAEMTPGQTPTGESGLPEELQKVMSQIEAQVVQLRGLQPTGPVNLDLISPEELQEMVITDFFSDYTEEEARQDGLILSALGLLPDGFDLKQFYNELYSEQIAGFYDSETKDMYVVQGTGFGGYEKITYAHEYTHVLQDQVYGLDEGLGMNEALIEEDSERYAGIQALIEGDATLTELLWFQNHATEQDYRDYLQAFEDYESPVLDSAPPYMAADLYFPYEYGYAFVQLLYDEGGYDAVDAAYEDVPVSTEQILHPERYPDDKPTQVALPDLTEFLGEEWTLYDQNVMGEWYTYLILNKAYDEAYQLSERIAEDAAEGWGGDAYAFYINESTDDVVFVMDTIWDRDADADDFVDAFIDYANLRWESSNSEIEGYPTWSGDDGTVVLLHESARTLWIMAPEDDMVESILAELR